LTISLSDFIKDRRIPLLSQFMKDILKWRYY